MSFQYECATCHKLCDEKDFITRRNTMSNKCTDCRIMIAKNRGEVKSPSAPRDITKPKHPWET